MYGPKRPLFTSSRLPHLGHFSVSRPERSWTSWMILFTSTAASARLNGFQKSPSTCCHARSPSSTLSSSVSISAVNPTSNTSGNERFSTFQTISPWGEIVWKVLKRSFPEVFEVGFTALMETELDKVEEGDLAWQQVLGDFWKPFNLALAAVDVNKIIHEVHDLSGLDTEKCPKCGSRLEVKSGRFGPYIACVRYATKECDYSRSIKKDRVPDRPSGEFLACTRYPKCKYTQPVPLGIKCPKCGIGDLAERRTKRGRTFYGCLRYPDCDYST